MRREAVAGPPYAENRSVKADAENLTSAAVGGGPLEGTVSLHYVYLGVPSMLETLIRSSRPWAFAASRMAVSSVSGSNGPR